jgi:DNA-binding PadR family transcriptional regulator
MRPPRTGLTLTEWVVLALVAEGPTHGWAIARAMRPGGSIGGVWSCRAPLVYRAIARLVEADLVRPAGPAQGDGPNRTLLEATSTGSEAVATWLREPVAHVRDLRSELLVKLLLLERLGQDRAPLVRRQRQRLDELAAGLDGQADVSAGSERLVALWRSTTMRAARDFLGVLDGEAAAP